MAQQINLYDPGLADQRDLHSFRSAAIGWLLVFSLSAIWAAYAGYSLSETQKQEQALTAQVEGARTELQKLSALHSARKASPAIAEEIFKLELELKGRQEIMDVLEAGGLGDTRGFSEHLRAFARQSFEGIWLTGLKIGAGGRGMSIEGRALQAGHVPNYLSRLNGETVMQGRAFSELMIQVPKTETGGKADGNQAFVEFRLSAGPAGDARKAAVQ
ncbi:MAG: hypothetical protein ACKVP2_09565 [Burkholderiales bacterium]